MPSVSTDLPGDFPKETPSGRRGSGLWRGAGVPPLVPDVARVRLRVLGEWFLVLLPLVLSALVYYPLTGVYFFGDDFLNLYRIVNEDLADYLLRPHGGHLLLARNAIFYLFYQAFGVRPELYFWVVLITHLVNVFLLFQVIRRLTGSPHLAAFGAALWGICPVHARTLGWYAVYGQVVVATILLFILSRVARVVGERKPLPRSAVLLWPALLLVGSTCFGVGIGIAMAAPAALFFLLPPSRRRTMLCLALTGLAIALPFIYRGLLAASEWQSGLSTEVFIARSALAAIDYWRALGMLAFLLVHGVTRLLLGFYSVQMNPPGTAAYVVTGLYVAAIVAVLARSSAGTRRQILALLLISIGAYGLIAAGRASFLQASNVAYAAAPPRYQYAASIPLVVVLCLVLGRLGEWIRFSTLLKYLAVLAWAGIAMFSYAQSRPFIESRISSRTETARVLDSVRSSVVAAPPGSDVYIRNQPFSSVGYLLFLDRSSFPGWAAVFAIFFPENVVAGRRVYFAVDDPNVLKAARKGRRTAELLVASDQIDKVAEPPDEEPRRGGEKDVDGGRDAP